VPYRRFENTSLNGITPSVLSAPLEMSSYAAHSQQNHTLEAATISLETEWPEQKAVDLHNLAKGIGWALTIEGAAALSLYAIWHLWLLLR